MKRFQTRLAVAALILSACAAADEADEPKDADPIVAAIHEEIEQDSLDWQLHMKLAGELRRKNRIEEAGRAAERAFALAPSPAIEARLELAKVHAAADRSASAINIVKDAERRKKEGEPVDEVKIAETYAIIGDVPAVFRWLDRAVVAQSPNIATLKSNPDFVSVHEDPRWADYIKGQ